MDPAVLQTAEHVALRSLVTLEDIQAEAVELERLFECGRSLQLLYHRQNRFYHRFLQLLEAKVWRTQAQGRAALKISERQLRYIQTVYNTPELQELARQGQLSKATIKLYRADGGGLKRRSGQEEGAELQPPAPHLLPQQRVLSGQRVNGNVSTAGQLFEQFSPGTAFNYLSENASEPLPGYFVNPAAASPYPLVDPTSFVPAVPGLSLARSSILRHSKYLISDGRVLNSAMCSALLKECKATPIKNSRPQDAHTVKTSLRSQLKARKEGLVRLALEEVCEYWGLDFNKSVHNTLFLISKPGCEEQFKHNDYPQEFQEHSPQEIPSSVIIALEEGTRLVIWEGDQRREIDIPVGYAVMFSRFCCLAGAAYSVQNIRFFFSTHKSHGPIEDCPSG